MIQYFMLFLSLLFSISVHQLCAMDVTPKDLTAYDAEHTEEYCLDAQAALHALAYSSSNKQKLVSAYEKMADIEPGHIVKLSIATDNPKYFYAAYTVCKGRGRFKLAQALMNAPMEESDRAIFTSFILNTHKGEVDGALVPTILNSQISKIPGAWPLPLIADEYGLIQRSRLLHEEYQSIKQEPLFDEDVLNVTIEPEAPFRYHFGPLPSKKNMALPLTTATSDMKAEGRRAVAAAFNHDRQNFINTPVFNIAREFNKNSPHMVIDSIF